MVVLDVVVAVVVGVEVTVVVGVEVAVVTGVVLAVVVVVVVVVLVIVVVVVIVVVAVVVVLVVVLQVWLFLAKVSILELRVPWDRRPERLKLLFFKRHVLMFGVVNTEEFKKTTYPHESSRLHVPRHSSATEETLVMS